MNDPAPMKIFLSYAQADDGSEFDTTEKSLMRRLFQGLTTAGFEVWWDRESMPSRSVPMSKEIEDALYKSDRFVLVVGAHLRESEWVRAEIAYARRACKPITMILRADNSAYIPDELKQVLAIPFAAPREYTNAFVDLIARLREDAPLGETYGVRPLPDFYLERATPFSAAHESICTSAVNPTVISAPTRSTTVSGYAGIGKSTLAIALAQDCEVRRFYKDGVIWVDVGQKPIITELQARIGVTVFKDSVDNYQDADKGRAALARVLRDKVALIILDDVWDRSIVEQFPTDGTRCRLLITTRSRTLAKQIDGADVPLEVLSDEEGATLIARRAGGNPEDPIYKQIAHLLGGHTLAIRLAAEQLANHYADSAADLLQLLTKQENLFAHLKLNDDDKEVNVERSLSLSYTALSSDLQQCFRELGAIAADSIFNRPMLAAVWEESSENIVRLPLSNLVNAGLVTPDIAGQYRQHGLLRAYAQALLIREGELQATFDHYADHIIKEAEQFDTLPLERWSQLDPLLPHVRYVGDALARHWYANQATSDEALLKRCSGFAYVVAKYVTRRPQIVNSTNGHEYLGIHWFEMGLAISQKTGNKKHESLFYNELGIVYDSLGEYHKAIEVYERSLSLDRSLGDRAGEATILNNIGRVWDTLSETRKALDYYKQALTIYRDLKDQKGEVVALNNIGLAWRALGEPHKALEHYEQVLVLLDSLDDLFAKAVTLDNVGSVWRILGEPRKALVYYEETLLLRRILGDKRGESTTLTNIGSAWRELNNFPKALEYFEQALPLRRAVGDLRGEMITLGGIATIYSQEGNQSKALAIFQQIIPIVRQLGTVSYEAVYLRNSGLVYEKMGQIADAIHVVEIAKRILVHYNLPQDVSGGTLVEYDELLARLREKLKQE